jgi:hypothetical protein
MGAWPTRLWQIRNWANSKPATSLTGVHETDEWHWAVEHLNVLNHLSARLQWTARIDRNGGAINRAFMPPFVGRQMESQTNSTMRRLVTQDWKQLAPGV